MAAEQGGSGAAGAAVKSEEGTRPLPSDEEIKRRLEPLIRGGDLQTMTLRTVVKQLEAAFGGVRLKPKKKMISAEITRIVNEMDDDAAQGEEPNALAESKAGVKARADRKDERTKEAKAGLARRAPKKAAASASSSSSSASSSAPAARVPPMLVEAPSSRNGLARPTAISPALAEFLRLPWSKDLKLPRTQVVKTLCAYVKENGLQDPEDRRQIVCDNALRELLGQERVTYFSMNKHLSPHFAKAPSSKKKAPKGGTPGGSFNAAKCLSPKLEAVVGKGPMSRPQVVKQLWVYIKAKELQDPADKRYIVCDDALREVMGTHRVHMMKMSALISKHIYAEGEVGAAAAPAKKAAAAADSDDDEDGEDDEDDGEEGEEDDDDA